MLKAGLGPGDERLTAFGMKLRRPRRRRRAGKPDPAPAAE